MTGDSQSLPPESILQVIRDKIAQLITIKGDPEALRFGIKDLQRALLQNPSACALMLPEDIGEAVKLIRYYTGKEAVDEQARKATSKKSTKMSVEEISNINIEDF
jgi:hypothetical protein